MATTYHVADGDVTELRDRVIRSNHPDLAEAGVLVGILMAENPGGDAVRHGGYPALACVRVVPLKDRVTKGYDVEMLIDSAAWADLSPRSREAVMDHELTHVRRVPNTPKAVEAGEAAWKTDDIGRPKIKLRKGDWNVGDGFAEVVARHGEAAVEFLNIQRAKVMADDAKASGRKEAA